MNILTSMSFYTVACTIGEYFIQPLAQERASRTCLILIYLILISQIFIRTNQPIKAFIIEIAIRAFSIVILNSGLFKVLATYQTIFQESPFLQEASVITRS